MTSSLPSAAANTMRVSFVHISRSVHVGASIEKEEANAFEDAVRTQRSEEVLSVVADVASVGVGAVFEQEPHGIWMTRRGVRRSRASGKALAREPGIALQRLAKRLDVSGRAGAHEFRDVRRPARIHLGLQRAPAREYRIRRDGQLRIGQLCRGLSQSQEREPFLGELLQVFVGRAFWRVKRNIDTFLPYAPGVRGSRAGSQGL